MLTYERREEIKKILDDEKTVRVDDLAKKFFVSPSTIRRDLDRIAGEGAIMRTHGGAVLLDNLASELPITLRERENTDAKQSIAALAADFIHSGATLILDTSSTVTSMIPYLNAYDGLTVITNGIKTAYLLNSYAKITTFCTGGRLREHNMSLVGAATCRRLEELNADFAFISCRGMSLSKGVTESSEEETQVKRAMISAAAKTVLLCDATKIGQVLMNRVCSFDSLYAIVTDRLLPKEYADYFENKGIIVRYSQNKLEIKQ
jgi:DeoR/GlpR family transcriptional regulator of sugar metabolism